MTSGGGSASWRLNAGLGVGLATGLVAWAWYRRSHVNDERNMTWEEVGEVEDLMLFPIKSGGGQHVVEATATNYGLVVGQVVDRSFVVIMTSASKVTHVTGGMAPILSTLAPKVLDGVLTLTPMAGAPISVDINKALMTDPQDFVFRGDSVTGRDCGDAVAAWLRDTLYPDQDNKPQVRLMYVGDPEQLHRPAKGPECFAFTQFRKGDMQLYHDDCAFLLAASSSLDDLNSKLSAPISMTQLRPNIVVKGRPAWEEDEWAFVRIGDEVQLRTVKPREACLRVNVNPSTGEKQTEVLNVLRQYRVLPMPAELAKHWRQKPFFGIHMALDTGGVIRVGDPVYAVRKKPHWLL